MAYAVAARLVGHRGYPIYGPGQPRNDAVATNHACQGLGVDYGAGQPLPPPLRYYNIIDFRFTNVSERTAALRQENIWFVPEIGRWVVRESRGIYREDVGTEVKESSYRWELLSWT